MKQKLPIGLQSFKEIREHDFLYVDKTEDICRLVNQGNYYFLSRPRRFGKSLLLSTIKELFQGRRDLFEGLWVEDQWDWSQRHPVVHIGFSSIGYQTLGLEEALERALDKAAEEAGIELVSSAYDQKFSELLKKLSAEKRVVLLIDEYDKPIIDYLDDIPQAKAHQKILKSFYSVIKDSDEYIRLLLITGVSKFSKASIFSELNNLQDLTIHPKFTTLLGYTQAELEHYFHEGIEELMLKRALSREEMLRLIKEWYNGYSWDGEHFLTPARTQRRFRFRCDSRFDFDRSTRIRL
ncbi:MAG: AAA family ATPase, partial [Bacteroidota bacterium]